MKYLNFFKKSKNMIFLVVVVFSITGFISSFVLTLERIYLLENPGAKLSCSINTTFNCATVMNSWQSEVLGFPNPLLGISGYTITGVIAVFYLLQKKVNKFFGYAGFYGSLAAVIFSYWLLYHSMYVINSLCPYCLVSCVSATMIFYAFLIYALQNNYLKFGENLNNNINILINKGWYITPISIWIMLMVVLIYLRFYT